MPVGTKTSAIFEDDDFVKVARPGRCQIECSDFEEIIDQAKSGDLIYADPPYTVKHNNNGFLKYNQSIFNWETNCAYEMLC